MNYPSLLSQKEANTQNDVSLKSSASASEHYCFRKNGKTIVVTPNEPAKYCTVRRGDGLRKLPLRGNYAI
jgi:ribosomal protein L33